jgi:hypothetical protein
MLALAANLAQAAGEVEITRVEGHYLDRLINMVIEWQSTNPVVKARITVGRETREMLVDEYENRRDPRGYHGTLTLQLPAEPQPSIPYTIQLEDDLRQQSTMVNGKISPTTATAGAGQYPTYSQPYGQTYGQGYGQTYGQSDDSWGKRVGGTQGYRPEPGVQTGSMVDRLIQVADRFDLAPSIDTIKVTILSPDNVAFATKANDDKGLVEVRFRVYDRKGLLIGSQSVTNLGKVWQGTSQTFTLGGGLFRVTAQAVDSTGNTSREQSTTFELTGKALELPQVQDTGMPGAGQMQGYQTQPYGSGTPATSTTPATQQPYDPYGQTAPAYQQPAGNYPATGGSYPAPSTGTYQDPYQQQMGTYQQPGYQQPANPYQQPGAYQQPSSNPYQQPSTPYQQPGTYQQPANPYQQPATPYQQPTDPYQQPGSYQQPSSNPYQQQPGTYPQPSTPTQPQTAPPSGTTPTGW